MLDKIREWISDNLRYILLGLAAILIVILAVIIVRVVTRNSSGSSAERVVIQTETEEETENEIALVRNQPDVLELATRYWNAYGEKDFDTLGEIYEQTVSEEKKTEIDEGDAAVEAYDNIMTYSKPGLTDGSYVVYVYMDLDLAGIETEAPTLRQMYMETDADGTLYVVPDDEYTADIQAYLSLRLTDSDVQALITAVNESLSEKCEEDEQLARYVDSAGSDADSDEDAVGGEDSQEAAADASGDYDSDSGEDADTGDVSDAGTSVGTATVIDGVNVRSEASTDGEIISALYEGLDVNVIQDMGDGWLEISFVDESGNTVTGYVKSDYLSVN